MTKTEAQNYADKLFLRDGKPYGIYEVDGNTGIFQVELLPANDAPPAQIIPPQNMTQYDVPPAQTIQQNVNIKQPLINPQFPDIIVNPDRPNEKPKILTTIENLKYLLNAYGITAEYDEILKQRSIIFAGHGTKGHDMEDEAALMAIRSLCALNGLSKELTDYLPVVFVENTVNPIKAWIASRAWDGIDRKPQLFQTLTVESEKINYRNRLLDVWFRQCVAACDNGEIGYSANRNAVRKFELTLVLQGGQGLKKTSWIKSLVPDSLREFIKDGMHLDTTDKDVIKKCISAWICELGELDATFRKSDIARLKAFLSNQVDEIRLPYDKTTSKFKRRTSFCASVNSEQFLPDLTGSRRFGTLKVLQCNHAHNLDMQQILAQYWHEYICGIQWWVDEELEAMMKVNNEEHNQISVVAEMVAEYFNVNEVDIEGAEHFTVTKILIESGIREPKPQQTKELTEFLQSMGFKRKQQKGIRGYWIAKYIKDSEDAPELYED